MAGYVSDRFDNNPKAKKLAERINNPLSKFRHNKKIELNLGGITFLFEIL
jgi:hypothetical protein